MMALLDLKGKKDEPYVRPLAEELNARIILPCDVRDEAQMEGLFESIQKEWGG